MNSPILTFPQFSYGLRQRPSEFELFCQCLRQHNYAGFLRETNRFGIYANNLYINSCDKPLKFILWGQLVQKISMVQVREAQKITAFDFVHFDQLTATEIADVTANLQCLRYHILSMTGLPDFNDFAKLLHSEVREVVFSGHILNIPDVDGYLKLFNNLTVINICQFWPIQSRAEITRVLQFFISHERPKKLKCLRYNVTFELPDKQRVFLSVVLRDEKVVFSVFGNDLE